MADGGTGDDVITVKPGVTSDATLEGGDGNDQLVYQGTSTATLVGARTTTT